MLCIVWFLVYYERKKIYKTPSCLLYASFYDQSCTQINSHGSIILSRTVGLCTFVLVTSFTCLLTLILAGLGNEEQEWEGKRERKAYHGRVYIMLCTNLYKYLLFCAASLLIMMSSLRDLFRMVVRMRLLCAFLLLYFRWKGGEGIHAFNFDELKRVWWKSDIHAGGDLQQLLS